jgi:hypothetical protein
VAKTYKILGKETSRYQWPLVDIAIGLHAMITGSADFEPVAAKRMYGFIKARVMDWYKTSFPYHANTTMALNLTEDNIYELCLSVLAEYRAYKKWEKK